MQTLTLPDGRTLATYDAGDSSGPAVVFHHGTPMSGKPFDDHAALATELGFRLVSYDRPGYGESTRAPGRSVADVAADVAAVADALGIERFATWGLSGGGPHALACAALLPERVRAVATVGSVGPFDAPDLDFMAGMGEGNVEEFGLVLRGEEAIRPMLEREWLDRRDIGLEEFADLFAPFCSDLDLAAVRGPLGAYLLDSMQTALARGVDGWVDDDLAFARQWGFEVDAVAAAVLLIQGRHDLMVPFAHGEWLARGLPLCEPRLHEDEGHLTPLLSRSREMYEWLLA